MVTARNGIKYTVILQAEADPEFKSYYNVSVPALPGCFTYGATREEALANAREAIEVYLDDLEMNDEPFPEERIEAVGIEFSAQTAARDRTGDCSST